MDLWRLLPRSMTHRPSPSLWVARCRAQQPVMTSSMVSHHCMLACTYCTDNAHMMRSFCEGARVRRNLHRDSTVSLEATYILSRDSLPKHMMPLMAHLICQHVSLCLLAGSQRGTHARTGCTQAPYQQHNTTRQEGVAHLSCLWLLSVC